MIKQFLALALLVTLPISASESAGEKFDLKEVLVHHLVDHAAFPFNIGGKKVVPGDSEFDPEHHTTFENEEGIPFHYVGGIDLHITTRVTMMWIVALLLFLVFIPAARMIAKNPMKIRSRFSNGVEVFIDFLRKDVVDDNMHGHGHPYYHYIFSLFFFVLFCNLIGIIPPVGEIFGETIPALASAHFGFGEILSHVWSGITPTGDVSVTAGLSILTLILIYVSGFIFQGPMYVIHVVPNGVPKILYILMWPLEFVISPLAKVFALTIRLLANMTAGHVIILALLGFIFEFRSYYVVPVSVVGSGLIYLLEIFVAFLQAYIFALLTSLFIGLSMHRH